LPYGALAFGSHLLTIHTITSFYHGVHAWAPWKSSNKTALDLVMDWSGFFVFFAGSVMTFHRCGSEHLVKLTLIALWQVSIAFYIRVTATLESMDWDTYGAILLELPLFTCTCLNFMHVVSTQKADTDTTDIGTIALGTVAVVLFKDQTHMHGESARLANASIALMYLGLPPLILVAGMSTDYPERIRFVYGSIVVLLLSAICFDWALGVVADNKKGFTDNHTLTIIFYFVGKHLGFFN
jgi:uncharacterized protein YwbE